jgi:photosystem II PsbX protein
MRSDRLCRYIKKTKESMTPSLMNFMLSLVAGLVIVLVPATIGLIFISQKDKVQRG